MVLPLRVVRTSPGLMADPPGMFSVNGVMAVILIREPRAAAASTAPSTAAAPPMSVFMVSMPVAVLSDRPPESKVMPLPTRARWGTRPSISMGSAGV